jgi:hypothetical protein
MRISLRSVAFTSLAVAGAAGAQNPRTIPTVVAEAMSMEWSMFGKPQFFDATTPTNWPEELVPAGARAIGGAAVGIMGGIRMQVAVFSFPTGTDPRRAMRELLVSSGYRAAEEIAVEPRSGFIATFEATSSNAPPRYCKSPRVVTFSPSDSARDPQLLTVQLADGELALQTCNGRRGSSMMRQRDVVDVPTLLPPAGSQALGSGGSGGDGDRMMYATIAASSSPNALLSHYGRQLLAGGWKAASAPANAGNTASQQFTFLQGQEQWEGTLAIVSSGNRHQVLLYLRRTG